MKHFTAHLLEWFAFHKRSFPWRESRDPYHIWVSEIMSQQTQIERVANVFYPKFMKKFPTLKALAKAEWEEDVFPVWDGLGYYRRGRNMLKTAKIILKTYDGHFPQEIPKLTALPGIGHYTATAILSFAFDEKCPTIDTNVSKIIKVLWPENDIEKTAQTLISQATSGSDWNSAMMDLASALRSGAPITEPLKTYFPPHKANLFPPLRTKKSPPKKQGLKKRVIEVGIACIWKTDGSYLIQSRPKGKSFVGFWEFPGGKREPGEDFRTCVKRELVEELGVQVSVRPHFYEELCRFKDTHLLLRFHRCQIQSGTPEPLEKQKIQWVHPQDFHTIKFLKTNGKALEKIKQFR